MARTLKRKTPTTFVTTDTRPLQRYWVFAVHEHEVVGGIDDLRGSYDSKAKAEEVILDRFDSKEGWGDYYWSIVDKETGEVTKFHWRYEE